MTKVFLSYTEEDEAVGQRLAKALVERGLTVYWWQDPSRQGGRFANEIENEIFTADRFVVVLSPRYLRSPWCIRERDMAVHLENDGRAGFITVFEAVPVHGQWTGVLSSYARIPLRDADWDTTVETYVQSVLGAHAQPAVTRTHGSGRPKPKFRNRTDELNLIVDRLVMDGGEDVWLVSAPPQLGKSWFLYEVADRVAQRLPNCQARVLDLHEQPTSLRSDPVLLFRTMLDLSTPLPAARADDLTDRDLECVAKEVSLRERPQLYLLDSVDLLETDTPEQLRQLLSEVFRRLSSSGSMTRIRVVISGRRVDKWRPVPGTRSRKLRLTMFTEDVVRAALVDLASGSHDLGAERIATLTRRLHAFCEGLPALLVKTLERIGADHFFGVDRDEWWQAAFDEVVRPYVENQLLSTDSLFLEGGKDLGRNKQLIELALKVLAPYRMVTRSHVKFHLDRDHELQTALESAGWGLRQLLEALYETALVVPVYKQPWYEIYPPIRRLLYRYYFADASHDVVQRLAQQYYQSGPEKPAGTERSFMLIEYIWHEVVRRSAGTDGELDDLPEFAATATDEFVRHSMYSAHELDQFASRLLEDDLELELALSEHPGLFDQLRDSIQAAIEAVADE